MTEVEDQITEQTIAQDGLRSLRVERNKLLAETDYMALSDVTLTTEWQTYRQALRDITENYSSLSDVVWPEKPE